jgi:hypothetical protein
MTELVSEKFPVIRENTGNFIESGPRSRPVAAKTQPIPAHYGQISLRRNNRESFADNREFYRMIRQFRCVNQANSKFRNLRRALRDQARR